MLAACCRADLGLPVTCKTTFTSTLMVVWPLAKPACSQRLDTKLTIRCWKELWPLIFNWRRTSASRHSKDSKSISASEVSLRSERRIRTSAVRDVLPYPQEGRAVSALARFFGRVRTSTDSAAHDRHTHRQRKLVLG